MAPNEGNAGSAQETKTVPQAESAPNATSTSMLACRCERAIHALRRIRRPTPKRMKAPHTASMNGMACMTRLMAPACTDGPPYMCSTIRTMSGTTTAQE